MEYFIIIRFLKCGKHCACAVRVYPLAAGYSLQPAATVIVHDHATLVFIPCKLSYNKQISVLFFIKARFLLMNKTYGSI